jgi:hypothetical protein
MWRFDMRVLVCGGRTYSDIARVTEILDVINGQNPELPDVYQELKIKVIISGHAKGADTLGEDYAQWNDIELEVYPAQWNRYGKRAGYVRNTQMLEEGKPDLIVAFPGGRGTAMMCDIARKAGVEVMEVE